MSVPVRTGFSHPWINLITIKLVTPLSLTTRRVNYQPSAFGSTVNHSFVVENISKSMQTPTLLVSLRC
ncbi:hypothetical protein Plhal304r1_c098g0174271 [Plasmopara halstedii]